MMKNVIARMAKTSKKATSFELKKTSQLLQEIRKDPSHER
jgi:hypothetical protein